MFENYDIEVIKIFKEAELERKKLLHEYVGTEHLLLAILKKNNDILKKFNLTYEKFLNEIKSSIEHINKKIDINIYTPLLKRVIYNAIKDNDLTDKGLLFHILDEGEGVAIRLLINMDIDVDNLYNYLKNSNNDNLEIYKIGKVLNDYIEIDDKVIGRDKEINLIIETLLRKKKNNPLLIGEAGVGKTAIVEELTRKIIKNDVPNSLLNCKIINLEMGSLVSGTRYRGEFEERLEKIIKEVKENNKIILFIDEIHSMVSAGAAEGAISASDILKPYLARGDIKCIGATTKQEYEKYFLNDKALSRRFETIYVNEPNEEETIEILKNIKDEYINYHHVDIKDNTIEILVHLVNTYFPNKKNPDKALELLDSVMSYVKLKENNTKIKNKELELKKISLSKIKELENGNYKEALINNKLENKIKKEINILKNSKLIVTNEDLIDILEYKNNIILSKRKIKIIHKELSKKYNNKILDIITNNLIKQTKVKTFMFIGNYGNIIEDLSKVLNYNLIKVNDDNSFDKMLNKVKYYPNSIIVINDNSVYINNKLKKITRDSLLEYNEEYINFNNAIIIILGKDKSIGFDNNYISNIPYNEIIKFDNKLLT